MTPDTRSLETAAATPLRAKALAYVRLAKLDMFDYYLSVLVVWTLLPPTMRLDGESLLVLAVFLLSEICVIAATVIFDDVTGYRDGSDAINYGLDAPTRRLARKPLLSGALGEAEAVRFGIGAWVLGALLCAASVALAPYHPAWVLLVAAAYVMFSVQYSWGLKIGYHGGQELLIGAVASAVFLVPYGLLAPTVTGFGVAQAALFGLGPLLIGVYSNINDITGDRSVRRPTVAATCSERVNALFILALSLTETLIIVGVALAGVAPWWFPLAMLPVIALRGTQLVTGLRRGNILVARLMGIRAHRTAVIVLICVNLVVWWAA